MRNKNIFTTSTKLTNTRDATHWLCRDIHYSYLYIIKYEQYKKILTSKQFFYYNKIYILS
jgi:hypothetical protein